METIHDRIIKAEEAFFNKYLQAPNMLVLRPEAKTELMDDSGMDFFGDMDDYEGMTVSVTFKDNFPEFKLAVG